MYNFEPPYWNQYTKSRDLQTIRSMKRERERERKSATDRQTLFVTGAFLDGVALSALGLEDLLSGLCIAGRCLIKRRHFCGVLKDPKRERRRRERESCDCVLYSWGGSYLGFWFWFVGLVFFWFFSRCCLEYSRGGKSTWSPR